jgi:hypothetical protein
MIGRKEDSRLTFKIETRKGLEVRKTWQDLNSGPTL